MDAIVGYTSSSDDEEENEVKMTSPSSGAKRKRDEREGTDLGEATKWRRTQDETALPNEEESDREKKAKEEKAKERGKGEEKKTWEKKEGRKRSMLIPTHVKRKKKNVSTEDYEKWSTAKDLGVF